MAGQIQCSLFGDLEKGVFKDDAVSEQYCGNASIVASCLSACQELRCEELNGEEDPLNRATEVLVKILTFFLVGGFAATVDHRYFYRNFKSRSVYIGVACQFLIMPALGFLSVAFFNNSLPPLYAVILITVTACPGGAYSNWFCSVFNGKFSLSENGQY